MGTSTRRQKLPFDALSNGHWYTRYFSTSFISTSNFMIFPHFSAFSGFPLHGNIILSSDLDYSSSFTSITVVRRFFYIFSHLSIIEDSKMKKMPKTPCFGQFEIETNFCISRRGVKPRDRFARQPFFYNRYFNQIFLHFFAYLYLCSRGDQTFFLTGEDIFYWGVISDGGVIFNGEDTFNGVFIFNGEETFYGGGDDGSGGGNNFNIESIDQREKRIQTFFIAWKKIFWLW